MRKYLQSLIWVWLLAGVAQAAIPLKQSTATQVIVKFVDATDGVTPETGLTVTNFDCNIVKHADSGISATALTITASGGSNDMAHMADGMYSLELTASNTDTVGRLYLQCHSNTAATYDAVPFEAWFEVVASNAWNNTIATGPSTIDDFLETDCSTIATSTSPFKRICDNLDVVVSQYSPVRLRTTIATLSSQTSFTLTAGSTDNDAYNGWLIYIQNQATAEQTAAGVVGDYTGSTKTIAMLNDPAVFTMAAGDYVYLIPDRSLKSVFDNRFLSVSSTNRAGINLDDTEGSLSTSAFEAGFLTDSLIASDAITAAKMATDAGNEIATAVWAATLTELSQGIPSATPSGNNAIMALYMALRNKLDVTSTTKSIYNDAGTVIFKKTLADNGVTFTESEAVSGP